MGYIFSVSIGLSIIPSLVTYLIGSYYLFPKFLAKNKAVQFLIFLFIIGIVGSIAGSLFLSARFGVDFMFRDNLTSFISEFTTMLIIALFTSLFGIVIELVFDWHKGVKLREVLTENNHKLQLASLQGKLEPHFLYNTLNNIESLIHESPSKASDYIIGLSDLLRYASTLGESNETELSVEINHLKKFIDLQKIRSVNPNFVRFEVDGKLDGIVIPSMIFIPVVENAFKYVLNTSDDDMILITLKVQAGSVQFKCKNRFSSEKRAQTQSSGIGNALLRERLELLFDSKHAYQIIEEEDLYCVKLTFEYE